MLAFITLPGLPQIAMVLRRMRRITVMAALVEERKNHPNFSKCLSGDTEGCPEGWELPHGARLELQFTAVTGENKTGP